MIYNKTLFALPMLVLFGLLLSLSGFSQAAAGPSDDEEDEEDFIVIGQPGLKPDTSDRYPGCAKPDNGSFNLWIEVRMANLDNLNLPCDLVVKAEISRPEDPETSVIIYSQPLQFSCSESGFCEDCPDATLCTAYGIFYESASKFLPLCDGRDGEKIDLNILASVSYSCEGQPFELSQLESAGCLGYLPESCFKVSNNGEVEGTGCLVCPEEIVVQQMPDTLEPGDGGGGTGRLERDLHGVFGNMSLSDNASEKMEVTIESNPVNSILTLKISEEWVNPRMSIIHTNGSVDMMKTSSQQSINIDVSRYPSGIYYLLVKSDYKTKMIPWMKL